MSDDRLDQEQKIPIHELSETPFGGGRFSDAEKKAASWGTEPEIGGGGEETETRKQTDVDTRFESEADLQKGACADQPGSSADSRAPVESVDTEPTTESAMAETSATGVDYSGTFRSLKVGDVVDGVVVHIDREGVLVDVGTKSEGTIRPGELTRDPSLSPEDVVTVGEKIKVYVVEPESQEGGPLLSKKRADFENAWDRVEKAYTDGSILKAMVTDRVKGGLVVDLGIRGFVPASHVGSGKVKNLEKYVGQSLPFKVIEVDRERRKVVLSNRLAVEEEQAEAKKRTFASLAEGQVREGVVRRITDYGAFVDLGGVDGLLHISEMSWTRIKHPSEAVKVGQKINVMVLKLNLEQERVSLGLRQILPDPWEEVKRLYSVGDVITGTVSRLVPFGAFVQVEGGIEGIIPNSELAQRRVNNPEDIVSVGQSVEVKVIDIKPDERRLTLSLRQLQAQREKEREHAEFREYSQSRTETGRTTIGDLIGDQLGDLSFVSEEPERPPKKKSRGKASRRRVDEEAEALAEAEEEQQLVAEIEAEAVEEHGEEPEAVTIVTDAPEGFTIADAVGEVQVEAHEPNKKTRKRTTKKAKVETTEEQETSVAESAAEEMASEE